MFIAEACERVQRYAELNTGGDILAAATEMWDLRNEIFDLDSLAIRLFMEDMRKFMAPKEESDPMDDFNYVGSRYHY
jgi:hypothetical protein